MEETNKKAEETGFDKVKNKVKDVFWLGAGYAQEAYDWAMDHKKEVVGVAAVTVPALKWLRKNHEKRQDEKWRNRSFYDRSTGQYYQTRKSVTQSQHLEIERRRRAGEPLGQILMSMRLL